MFLIIETSPLQSLFSRTGFFAVGYPSLIAATPHYHVSASLPSRCKDSVGLHDRRPTDEWRKGA
ncbi:hypothetical protein [Prevotella corporis]|uniref:hypothetical protein n=1 Tax=Prevotella corporis TaxID=28128 RepID=UPI0012B5102E|nr:hypothetical protein [Prevotella corporis]